MNLIYHIMCNKCSFTCLQNYSETCRMVDLTCLGEWGGEGVDESLCEGEAKYGAHYELTYNKSIHNHNCVCLG